MSVLIDQIKARVGEAIQLRFPEVADISAFLVVTSSTKEKFGDYQCNSAMPLAKALKQPPRAIAEALQGALAADTTLFAKVEVAGPGFINLYLNDGYLIDLNHHMFFSDDLGVEKSHMSERVIVDYSSPNVAKDMHVGHLRSTIIGDCLARVFRYLGYDVLALSHIGDWGTAFGMLITYLEEVAPEVLASGDHQEPEVSSLVAWYKEAKLCFDEDEGFKKRAQLAVVALQQGDPAKRAAWQRLCEISRRSYQPIYDLLDVHLEERGESFYQPFLADVLDDLRSAELLTVHDGASCVFLEQFKNREGDILPLIVQKSDGGYNYATTDLAAVKHRAQVEKAGRILYVVDAGQSTHFAMVFEVARKAGYLNGSDGQPEVQLSHVPFGLVLGEDGKKFKTRSGRTEKLMDLLQEAVARSKQVLQDRGVDWDAAEIDQTAAIMGLGAVKYADLSVNKTSDYQFSYEKMLRFDGNTAIFVMYAYVRLCSIMRAVPDADVSDASQPLQITHPTERALALHLARFEEFLNKVIKDHAPNRLTDYCYRLAELCNAFHRDCRVAGSELQASRLRWCELSRRTLCASLDLLGIGVPTRM